MAPEVATRTDTSRDATLHTVTVVGEGRVAVDSAVATVRIGVEVERTDVEAAFADASDAIADVVDAVRAEGVDDADVRTVDVSVRQQFDGAPPLPDEPTTDSEEVGSRSYVATNVVEVTLRDLDRAGAVLAVAVASGGDAARIQRFDLSPDDEPGSVGTARSQAIADAEQRASEYADAAGRELGELLIVEEVSGAIPPLDAPEAAEDAAAGPPIETGEHEIMVRVRTTWALD